MKTRHTPGKWSVGVYETTPTMIERLLEKPQSCVCLDEDGKPGMLIALCGDADDKQSQQDADLLAAAPDLLAGLEQAVKFFDDNGGDESYTWLSQMKAAIAKARGEK